jgi:glutathione-specific gamma-glutamylcyclotransferase
MAKNEDLLVFAYGSLMWDPGFSYEEVCSARLFGYHRSFCVLAWIYRGSLEKPGLVLGLDRGGSCVGRAFRVAAQRRDEVVQYLDEREIPDLARSTAPIDVYQRKFLNIRLSGEEGATAEAEALCYVAEPRHAQYAGKLRLEEQVRYIVQGVGTRGTSVDYLENTIDHLDQLGIGDGPLHKLRQRVRLKIAEGR